LAKAKKNVEDSPAVALMRRYQRHPELFCTEILGVQQIPPEQLQILQAVPRALREHKPLVVPSGHAMGKDFISSCLALALLYSYPPSKVILTAPTDRQLREIMWNEITSRWKGRKVEMGGKLYESPKLEINEEWFILGFVTSRTQEQVGKAQGFHSPHIFVIASEAQAIPDDTYTELDGVLTSDTSLLVMIGNPLRTTGKFARAIKDPEHNIVLHLDCETSPNVIEGRDIIPGMVSKAWVDDKRREWFDKDPNHPLWLSKVKGQLPRSAIENVFSWDMIERGCQNRPDPRQRQCVVGVDPAAFGDDETAFVVMESGVPREVFTTAKHEPTDTAGRAQALRVKHKAGAIAVDSDGLGEGVASMLREQLDEADKWVVISVKGSEKPTNPKSDYANKRAEMWFYCRDLVVEGRVQIPDDLGLKEELSEVEYTYSSSGKIQLERKKDVKERLGRSPDRADAFVYAVWGTRFAPRWRDAYESDPYPFQDVEYSDSRTQGYMVA
jgi:hypothetical protein